MSTCYYMYYAICFAELVKLIQEYDKIAKYDVDSLAASLDQWGNSLPMLNDLCAKVACDWLY